MTEAMVRVAFNDGYALMDIASAVLSLADNS